MADTLDRIIINGVEQDVGAGADMTEPWKGERDRREKTEENRQKLPPVDPPFPIPEGGGGGGGSGVLVAHASVDYADIQHEAGIWHASLSPDKTFDEMKDVPFSIIELAFTQDSGETLIGKFVFPLQARNAALDLDNALLFDAPPYFTALAVGGIFTVYGFIQYGEMDGADICQLIITPTGLISAQNPDSDGTYTLQMDVSDGGYTTEWVSTTP